MSAKKDRVRTASFASVTSNASNASNTSKKSDKAEEEHRKLAMLSQVIPAKHEYEWWEMEINFAHETIRRNALRGEKALESMDVVTYPWQMKHFNHWLSDFFFEVIRWHEHVKRDFVEPAYREVGETAPLGQYGSVDALLSSIEELSRGVVDLQSSGASKEEVLDLFQALKEDYVSMVDYFYEQYKFEEEVWMPIYKKHGEQFFMDLKRTYIAHSRGLPDSKSVFIFQFYIGSCFYDVGLDFNKYPSALPTALHFDPWMTVSWVESYAMKNGSLSRKKLIPSYILQFLKWNLLIESCTGVDDIVDPTTEYYV